MATEIRGSRVTSPGGGYAKTSQGADAIVGEGIRQVGGLFENYLARIDSDKLAQFTLDTDKFLLDLRAKNVLPAERESLLNRYFKDSERPGSDILKVRQAIKVNKGRVKRLADGSLREFDKDTDAIVGGEANVGEEGKMLGSVNNLEKGIASTQATLPLTTAAYESGIIDGIRNDAGGSNLTIMHTEIQERFLNAGAVTDRINDRRVFNGTHNIGVLDDMNANQEVRAGEWKRTVELAVSTLMNTTIASAYDDKGNLLTRNGMEGVVRAFKQDMLKKTGTTFQNLTGLSIDQIVTHLDKQVTSVEQWGSGVLDKGINGTVNQRNKVQMQARQLDEFFMDDNAKKALLARNPAMHKLLVDSRIRFTRAVAETVTSLANVGELGTAAEIMEKALDPVTTEIAEDGIASIAAITDGVKFTQKITRLSQSIAMYDNIPLQQSFSRAVRKKIEQWRTKDEDFAEDMEDKLKRWETTAKGRSLYPKAYK
jgi:hypothetical protein